MAASMHLDARSLVSRIADSLREQIITGKLEPGMRIRQDEYAEAFGVSRTPLREAFRLLESEGWIDMRPRSGVEVSRFSSAEVQEISAMRLLLEPLAIRVATVSHTDADERSIRDIARGLIAEQPSDGVARFDAIAEANRKFHYALYGFDDEVVLDPIQSGLRGYWERYSRYRRVYWNVDDHLMHSNEGHQRILDAWSARDADRAERELARHILGAVRSLVYELDEHRASSFSPTLHELAKRYDFDLF
ncbi:GntR family transcriptional regulator [Rhodococcus sp. ACS1]|uniref:GntR family transcriptional regulator n=1 Tax=Rhodococcus TaxID=1827 RepID=UPI000BB10A3A|nr:GntR family transcriptional regulator [Rhodococcus sp. ACS1]PBC47948.1 GntR family transcriptional regulator [Rhodococcus sp. ACS1]